MARFHAISSEKQLRDMAGESLQTLVIIAIVLGAAAAVAVVGLSSNKQTFAVAGGLCIGAICIFASGNPRLACLWGFMLTLPLSLSKRVGPMYIGKPGGEDSFRIEVNRPVPPGSGDLHSLGPDDGTPPRDTNSQGYVHLAASNRNWLRVGCDRTVAYDRST